MTMWSFRVDEDDASEVRRWVARLGVDRSALLREALKRHLVRLNSDLDIERWQDGPLGDGEHELGEIADWGLAEDWSDWVDATR